MKILLLGDYSALHKNLKEGLIELGHEALLASHGDGWKEIPRDIDLSAGKSRIYNKIYRRLIPFLKLNKLSGHHVVQLINPFVFYERYFPSTMFLRLVLGLNEKAFMLGAGDDAFFWRYARKSLDYGPFDDFLEYDLKSKEFYLQTEKALLYNKQIVELVRGIIPIMYEYEVAYSDCDKRITTIPIPVNTNTVNYLPNNPQKKLTIFHGLNRYGFKGTRHVEEAFTILSKKYPNDLELIIDGNMPLNEYIEVMQRTNVVIDQLNSYSLGVNGVMALAMGKIVMGGAEPESLRALGIEQSPVINLKPSAKSIITAVENLLENKSQIEEMGYLSRQFAENVHGHVHIAQRYIDAWAGR